MLRSVSTANGQTEIRKGLQAGQKGRRVGSIPGRFRVEPQSHDYAHGRHASGARQGTDVTHRGQGKVENIGKEEITISHGPIASLQWGAMTMGFKLPATGLPQGVAVGNSVSFEIRQTKDGAFQIISIAPAESNAAPTDTAAKGVITKPRDNASPGVKP